MSRAREWMRRVAGLFRKRRRDAELEEELAAHLELLMEENVERGMTPEEARRAARVELGGAEQIKEAVREQRGVPLLESLWQDVRFGLRTLAKSPGFTTVAVLTLALGIGANTAIFSIVDAVLLRPLPFQDPSRLMVLHEGVPKIGYPKMSFSPPDLAVFVREQTMFAATGAFRNEHVDISGHGEPERVVAARISSSLFPMLGVEPLMGRNFAPEEDKPGDNVVLLSYGLWQRRYGRSRSILGQTIKIDRQPYVVAGIMPKKFEFPLPGPEDNGTPADLYVPMAFTPAELQDWGGSYFTTLVGRLWPGVTVAQANSEAESLARAIEASYPPALTNAFHGPLGLTISAVPFQQEVSGSVRALLLVLMAAVGFVLLIACANIATLLVSRAAARQKEIAIRVALGATRLRLARQMLTESLVLAVGGGMLGFALAFVLRDLTLAFAPASIPLSHEVPINADLFAFAIGVSVLCATLFGLAPAFLTSASSMQRPLQEGGRSATPSRSHHRLQGFFVTMEFALALVPLAGAGLLIRSFGKLLETNPGFRPENVLTLNVPLPRQAYPTAAQIQDFYRELLDRISNLPGVQNAGLSNDLPLSGREMVSMTVEGGGHDQGQTPQAIAQSWVLGNYFQTMRIPLLQGRLFTPEDRIGSEPVAIVSLSTAQRFWPNQSAIGKRIHWGTNDPWQTIVGIVGDVNQGPLTAHMAPHVYRPYNQLPAPFLEEDPFSDWHAMNVAVRTQVDPTALISAVLAEVHSLDPDLAIGNIRTMTEVIRSSVAGPEFDTMLLGGLAALALFLSAVGVYGVLAYVVAQQTHEIGIRMALGAKPGHVHGLILRRGARLAGVGVGVGLAAAGGLTQLMKGLLYGVSATDPLTFAGVVILLSTAGLLACWIPARRAMRVDPMVALRHE